MTLCTGFKKTQQAWVTTMESASSLDELSTPRRAAERRAAEDGSAPSSSWWPMLLCTCAEDSRRSTASEDQDEMLLSVCANGSARGDSTSVLVVHYKHWRDGVIPSHRLDVLNSMPPDGTSGLLWWQWVERELGICKHDPPVTRPAFLDDDNP